MDHMKITSPIGLNLLVDGTVPKVWNLFCFLFNLFSPISTQPFSLHFLYCGTVNTFYYYYYFLVHPFSPGSFAEKPILKLAE